MRKAFVLCVRGPNTIRPAIEHAKQRSRSCSEATEDTEATPLHLILRSSFVVSLILVVNDLKATLRTSNFAKKHLWREQRNHPTAVPAIAGEMRIESEDAAIGMKFTQSDETSVR